MGLIGLHPPESIDFGAVPRCGAKRLPQTVVTTSKRQGIPADSRAR